MVYEIHVDNNGDAVEDITFQLRFTTEIRNPDTFLYNTGPVTSLDDPDLNVRQFYRLTRMTVRAGPGRRPSCRAGCRCRRPTSAPRSTPNYGGLGGGIQRLAGDIAVFAGQRDEGFFVDLGGLRPARRRLRAEVEDSTAGFNVQQPRDPGADDAR